MVNSKAENQKKKLKSNLLKFSLSFILVILLMVGLFKTNVYASGLNIDITSPNEGAFGAIELMLTLMVMALLPSMLVLTTSFTRIIIVLSLLRSAMGTQQSPPNQVLIGLALFLTLFIMTPTLTQVNDEALQPFFDGEITQQQAIDGAIKPMKSFMIKQMNISDLNLFLSLSNTEPITLPEGATNDDKLVALENLPIQVIVPAFITGELKTAFTIGFLMFIPFLIIDMVVSSTLMSMGMVMLPPSTVALPFKLMLFVLANGWELLFGAMVRGFH